jgi:hypothetical protein
MVEGTACLIFEILAKFRFRAAGLCYVQNYLIIKEILVAANTYSFINTIFEILTIDSRVWIIWKYLDSGASVNFKILLKTYLVSKIRYAFRLAGSRVKRFRTRKKYRFIKILFDRLSLRVAAETSGASNLEFSFYVFYYFIATANFIE